jgi:hypothetical protein
MATARTGSSSITKLSVSFLISARELVDYIRTFDALYLSSALSSSVYCLEAVPVILAVFTMAYYHPSRFGLPSRKEDAKNAKVIGIRKDDDQILLKSIERIV